MSDYFSGSGSGNFSEPTEDSDMGNLQSLATAAITVSLISILFTLLMTVVVFFLLYYLFNLRKTSGKGGAYGRTGSREFPNDVNTNVPDPATLKELEHQIECVNPMLLAPPSSPGGPQQTQTVPLSPPLGLEEPQEATRAQEKPPCKEGYADLSLGDAILPPELRTMENLQGHSLTADEVLKLEEDERKEAKRYLYEETQMRERREEELVASIRKLSKQQGKEKEKKDSSKEKERDVYFSPADAIPEDESVRVLVAGKKCEGEEEKKFGLQVAQGSGKEKYSQVFDCLPAGEKKRVVNPKEKSQSDTSPPLQKKKPSPPPPTTTIAPMPMLISATGYEEVPDDHFKYGSLPHNSTSPSVLREGKNNVGPHTKRYSHPARHNAGKEMVEVNPHSHKPVTLSSQRKKHHQDQNEDTDSPADTKDADESKPTTTETSPTSDGKTFAISSEPGPSMQDSYALVDLASKRRYRAESDMLKKEGSGTPQHYTVKEKLLEIELERKSEDTTTVSAQA